MDLQAGYPRSTEPAPAVRRIANSSRVANPAALFFLVFLQVLCAMSILPAAAKLAVEKLTLHTSAGAHVIATEIAETLEDKQRGLMFRTSVPAGTGMLFAYDQPQELTMWMRNTYVSLDMIFIRADGIVHRIARRTEPLSERIIASEGAVTAVLELAAGEADRLGLKPGDRVEHRAFKPAKR